MIISKNALRDGFSNETDKKNTAVHEFVHLIDKMDGAIDGVPEVLLQKQYTIPWLELMKKRNRARYEDQYIDNRGSGVPWFNNGAVFSAIRL